MADANKNDIVDRVFELLCEKNVKEAEAVLADEANLWTVEEKALELIEAVKSACDVSEPGSFGQEDLSRLYGRLAEVGKPKLAVLGLQGVLAGGTGDGDDFLTFSSASGPLAVAMMRLSTDLRPKLWADALESVLTFLKSEAARDDKLAPLNYGLDLYCDFASVLCRDVGANGDPTLRRALAWAILEVMETPVASLDLAKGSGFLSAARRLAGLLMTVSPNAMDLVEVPNATDDSDDEEKKLSLAGLGVALHLNFAEELRDPEGGTLDLVPWVCEPSHLFLTLLPAAKALTEASARKGLALTSALLDRMEDGRGLSVEAAESDAVLSAASTLAVILSFTPEEPTRKSAFSCLSSLHSKLAFEARAGFYVMLDSLESVRANASFRGWIAGCLKDSAAENLKRGDVDRCEDFSGERLRGLARRLVLFDVAAVDLAAEVHRVQAAAAFFGCLFALDRAAGGASGIREMREEVAEGFVEAARSRLPGLRSLDEMQLKEAQTDRNFVVPDSVQMDRDDYAAYLRSRISAVDLMMCSLSAFNFE